MQENAGSVLTVPAFCIVIVIIIRYCITASTGHKWIH
ncbi:hypothetical protein CLOBOL_05898 [Enterocloster bolteae ATCC BAA-613]|uniref:Uncharacterized protein n=1 Tax=Enterocloster bolteae (strain ATCC BAA-613 / DSM 15670 / CCUG 46953 / JCM 12243 / WAL 16351) TaxID=411902 RepID=A8S199_ENTBW|nr:hypothetical protein CLOBOL_05898 [Enterocloster bolteae ATCC BAA-613]